MTTDEIILEALATPMSVARVIKRTGFGRLTVINAIERLRKDAKVRAVVSSGGRTEWQRLSPNQTEHRLALRALMGALRQADAELRLLDDLDDVGHFLSTILRLPDDVREKIALLSDAYDKTLE